MNRIHKYTGGLAMALLVLPTLSLAAPAVPAPGESIQPPAELKDPLTNETPAEAQPTGEQRFTITGIWIEHEGLKLDDRKLSDIMAPIIGRESTLTEGILRDFRKY